jgi:hypothetical protein
MRAEGEGYVRLYRLILCPGSDLEGGRQAEAVGWVWLVRPLTWRQFLGLEVGDSGKLVNELV